MSETQPDFVRRHRVEFAETDMAGLMHFSNFFRLMEATEHAWFREHGLSIHEADSKYMQGGELGWPRVHASADYKSPLRFEDEVDIELRVSEVRPKTIRYAFTFRLVPTHADKAEGLPGAVAATGEVVAACVTLDRATGKLSAIEIPPVILDKLGVL